MPGGLDLLETPAAESRYQCPLIQRSSFWYNRLPKENLNSLSIARPEIVGAVY